MIRRPLVLLVALLAGGSYAQNHPELNWEVIETPHFRILYHDGLGEAAARAAEIAEAAYEPVTALYRYRPEGKVRIVLKDYDDYANGAAFFYLDTIEIWTTSLDHDFDLRGTSDWLRNVITHEFVHIISLGAARKSSQRVPALYFQHFGYQRERNRPDILIGYPDVLVSYPVTATTVPMWFAEGVAQHQVESARHDRWDANRDMVLRTALLEDRMLSFDQMGVFGHRGFGNEFVYDHGYGLVRYIATRFGDETLARLCAEMSKWRALEIDAAIEKVLGVTARQLHTEWRAAMRTRYEKQVAELGQLRAGTQVSPEGFSNLHPVFSPTGDRLAYLSTRRQEYGPHHLVVRDLANGEEEIIASGVVSRPSWAPDGRRIAFVRKRSADRYGSLQADVYSYDFDAEDRGFASDLLWAVPNITTSYTPKNTRVERLSTGLRALYPAYSPDGDWIAFVRNSGATNNLGMLRADDGLIVYLTDFADGTQLYTPCWSSDGSAVAVSVSRQGQRDIALVRIDRKLLDASAPQVPAAASGSQSQGTAQELTVTEIVLGFDALVTSPGTDRDPQWTEDGAEIVYASDVSGIFNLYAIELSSRKVRQITNVLGGAMHSAVGSNGAIAFTAYGADGFRIRSLAPLDTEIADGDLRTRAVAPANPAPANLATSTFELASLAGDAEPPSRLRAPPPSAPRDYDGDFLRTMIFPRAIWDEGRFKAGAYASSSDVLARQNVFGGLAVAPSNGDRELFAQYEHRGLRPTFFLEFYHQKRHTTRGDSSDARDAVITGMSFNLNQLAVGVRFGDKRLAGRAGRRELTLSLTYDRYDASLNWDAFVPRSDGAPGFERRKMKPIGYTYLNGFDLGLRYDYEAIERRRDRAINPRGGRRITFRYDRMFNYFIEEFNQNNTSFLQEKYLKLFYNQWELDWTEHVGLPLGAALDLRFYGGWVDSYKVDDPDRVDDFFDFHLGGLQYMKGYTFYSIEGRKAAMGMALLRFPLLADIRQRVLHLYLDKLYGAVYGDVGKAWDGNFDDRDPFYGRKAPLRDVGAQLRLDSISYYSLPTRVQADLAYGIDELSGHSPWKFYMTVLFGYL